METRAYKPCVFNVYIRDGFWAEHGEYDQALIRRVTSALGSRLPELHNIVSFVGPGYPQHDRLQTIRPGSPERYLHQDGGRIWANHRAGLAWYHRIPGLQ
jgi:hypothetical protein